MADDREPNFERLPTDGPLDETDVSLRAYFARLTDEHLAEYDPAWPDDRVVEWDGNFRSDGALMLTTSDPAATRETFQGLALTFEEHDPTGGVAPESMTVSDLRPGAAGRGSLG